MTDEEREARDKELRALWEFHETLRVAWRTGLVLLILSWISAHFLG